MASSSPGKTVELTALTRYLHDLTPKWIVIGIKLGQENCVRALSPLEDMTPEDKCLVVINKWIDSGKDVTWSRICSVLCSESVDLEKVAEQMQQVNFDKLDNYLAIHQFSNVIFVCILYSNRPMHHRKKQQKWHQWVSWHQITHI